MSGIPKMIEEIPYYRLDRLPSTYTNYRERYLVVEEGTNKAIALVSDKYFLIQPREIFAEIYRAFLQIDEPRDIEVYSPREGVWCMEVTFHEAIEASDSKYYWGFRVKNSVTAETCLTLNWLITREVCWNIFFILAGRSIVHIKSPVVVGRIEEFIGKIPRFSRRYLEKLIELNSKDILDKEKVLRICEKFPHYITSKIRFQLLKEKDRIDRWTLLNELSAKITPQRPIRRARMLERLAKITLYPK